MDNTFFIITGFVILIALILIIIFSKSTLLENNSEDSKPAAKHIPPQHNPPVIPDAPILTNHASERMEERLGVTGHKQTELMNNAFKYGRTSDRTTGDIKAKLESAELKYGEETVAKFYGNSIFIFTAEDNILKTVYPFNNNDRHYWN